MADGPAASAHQQRPYRQEPERAAISVAPKRRKSETRVRTEQICLRMTTDEAAAVRALAAEKGMSVPDLLRACFKAIQMTEST